MKINNVDGFFKCLFPHFHLNMYIIFYETNNLTIYGIKRFLTYMTKKKYWKSNSKENKVLILCTFKIGKKQ